MRFLSTITIFFCLTLSSLYAQETDYAPREVSWEAEWIGGEAPQDDLSRFPVPGLDWVKCSYDSEHGRIVSNWKRRGKKIIWKVEVPVPATALIPSADGSGREVRELAPGKYRFKF